MSEILKPCPFCGETASIERYGDPRQSTIYQCDNCSCRLETGEECDHGKLWNRRSDLGLSEERDRLREENERLLGILKSIKTYGELACVDVDRGYLRPSGKKPATKDVWQFPRHILADLDEAISLEGGKNAN